MTIASFIDGCLYSGEMVVEVVSEVCEIVEVGIENSCFELSKITA